MASRETSPGRIAVVAGASGLVGGHCLNALLASPCYQRVISVARHASATEHPKLVQQVVNFDRLAALPPLEGADVFCALGTTIRKAGSQEAFRRVDYEYPLRLAVRAREAGASRFVLVSSVGADEKSKNFYLRVKGELEKAIAGAGFSSVLILRPSILLGSRVEFRLGERIGQAAARAGQFLLAGSWRRYRAVPASEVGCAMVEAAQSGAVGTHIYEWAEIHELASRARECSGTT